MADIQFEEEQFQRPVESEKKSLFIRLVLATRMVSTDREAEYVLLGIAGFLIILAFIIPTFLGGSQARVPQNAINAALTLPPPNY
jgi:hypothetical protein